MNRDHLCSLKDTKACHSKMPHGERETFYISYKNEFIWPTKCKSAINLSNLHL
jgi:hypothetical protein